MVAKEKSNGVEKEYNWEYFLLDFFKNLCYNHYMNIEKLIDLIKVIYNSVQKS